ncbi:MAG: tRNA 4-thiouridine(8) synthase ThiI [Candidatus Omnitrophica bacterium]|nr:tRNA 4-thiouridine(8) synthase ThiI [Candidatus Omnitrophota bacterium]MBU1869688.1 tRNA 4-thiouridine(8) synthase ThiI [Candidatus Omnitrophota bacterium]
MIMMKAISLISGGLDSILAARLIKEQGLEIIPVKFKIPFCHSDKKKEGGAKDTSCLVREALGVELKEIDISEDFLKLLVRPKHGFGSNINPCIDCKILMFSKARELMREFGASFVITGEVLGQRPMSQYRKALELIERKSGLEGLLLRPLSAGLFPESLPEKEGWVKRDKLMVFCGRQRRPQMELAKEFKIEGYPNPAGGCLLTDPAFAKRLRDMIKHQQLDLDNAALLKIGRHLRLTPAAKLIVGRCQREDEELVRLAMQGDYLFMPGDDLAGATALGRGEFSDELIKLSCNITCRYCDLNGKISADIFYRRLPEASLRAVNSTPEAEKGIANLRI